METVYHRPSRQRRRGGLGLFFAIFIAVALATIGWLGYMKYIPSKEKIDPSYSSEHPIIMQGVEQKHGALIQNGNVLLPLPLLDGILAADKPIHYEQETGTLVMTTLDKVLRLKTDALTGMINQKPYTLSIAAEVAEDIVYIPMEPLEELYGFRAEYDEGSGIVTLLREGNVIQQADVSSDDAPLRSAPSIREPYLLRIPYGETVRIWSEQDGWLLVQDSAGHIGYLNKKHAELTAIERIPETEREPKFVPWKVMGHKINMTWEAVYNRKIDYTKIGDMPGVNVVSPTWFELVDSQGTIKGKADPGYVKWAHERGYQVWALFNNGFEPDQTTEALSKVETRFSMIQQLIAFAELYDLQGINIDFENVYTKDKENLVQFVKELTPLLHEQGLVVSIDVTPKSNSEMWSAFLDRESLGRVVDYMMVMAYDEHWAASPKAGSVASIPWTDHSVARILEEDGVPAQKLVLSMPLYTRVWTEQKDEQGKVKVSSKAIGMESVKAIVEEKDLKPVFDEVAGQNYVEYEEDGALKRIWLEDDVSMRARVDIVRKYDLAGVATWARSFQTPAIWSTIDEALTKRP
ncbi:glycosyl hydrolase family 18 protein [Paenibacillus chungangensis]|uniref:Glycosyl hydrolase family 18 protein n=1 Tax=Paenibacillus chungangensis TaxID=696535 RepID=A0ABW3HT10_9BACL